nr:hypothetical protein [Geodermatophilus normandii]
MTPTALISPLSIATSEERVHVTCGVSAVVREGMGTGVERLEAAVAGAREPAAVDVPVGPAQEEQSDARRALSVPVVTRFPATVVVDVVHVLATPAICA